MKIKVFLNDDSFKIVNILVSNDLKQLADKYSRWEYVL